ncbi:MAG: hypothetical protein DRH97_01905 [Chloroflexi bacterium]|nr:MAG: hypothetical protein DRH97_01905 [Chloroflexota bacterium]
MIIVDKVIEGLNSIANDPEQIFYLAGGVASPIVAEQIPSTEGWPWWSSFLLAVGWLALAYMRSILKHKREVQRIREEVEKEIEDEKK